MGLKNLRKGRGFQLNSLLQFKELSKSARITIAKNLAFMIVDSGLSPAAVWIAEIFLLGFDLSTIPTKKWMQEISSNRLPLSVLRNTPPISLLPNLDFETGGLQNNRMLYGLLLLAPPVVIILFLRCLAQPLRRTDEFVKDLSKQQSQTASTNLDIEEARSYGFKDFSWWLVKHFLKLQTLFAYVSIVYFASSMFCVDVETNEIAADSQTLSQWNYNADLKQSTVNAKSVASKFFLMQEETCFRGLQLLMTCATGLTLLVSLLLLVLQQRVRTFYPDPQMLLSTEADWCEWLKLASFGVLFGFKQHLVISGASMSQIKFYCILYVVLHCVTSLAFTFGKPFFNPKLNTLRACSSGALSTIGFMMLTSKLLLEEWAVPRSLWVLISILLVMLTLRFQFSRMHEFPLTELLTGQLVARPSLSLPQAIYFTEQLCLSTDEGLLQAPDLTGECNGLPGSAGFKVNFSHKLFKLPPVSDMIDLHNRLLAVYVAKRGRHLWLHQFLRKISKKIQISAGGMPSPGTESENSNSQDWRFIILDTILKIHTAMSSITVSQTNFSELSSKGLNNSSLKALQKPTGIVEAPSALTAVSEYLGALEPLASLVMSALQSKLNLLIALAPNSAKSGSSSSGNPEKQGFSVLEESDTVHHLKHMIDDQFLRLAALTSGLHYRTEHLRLVYLARVKEDPEGLAKSVRKLVQNRVFLHVPLKTESAEPVVVMTVGGSGEEIHKIKSVTANASCWGHSSKTLVGEDLEILLPRVVSNFHRSMFDKLDRDQSSNCFEVVPNNKTISLGVLDSDGYLEPCSINFRYVLTAKASVEITGYFFKQNQHSKKSKPAKQDVNQSELLLTEDGHILDLTSDASAIFSKQTEISQYYPALGLTIHRAAVASRGKESKSTTKSINSLQNRETDVSTPGRRRQQQKKEAEALALDEWHHLQLEESGVKESLKRTLFHASRSGSHFSDFDMPHIAISTRCKLSKMQFPRADKYCFVLKIVWLNPGDDDLESRYEPSESNRGFSGYSARVESSRKLAAQWAFEEKQVSQDVEYAYLEDFLVDYSAILRDERLLQKCSLNSDKVMESTSDSKKRKSLFTANQDEKKIKKQVLKRNDVVPRHSKPVADSLEARKAVKIMAPGENTRLSDPKQKEVASDITMTTDLKNLREKTFSPFIKGSSLGSIWPAPDTKRADLVNIELHLLEDTPKFKKEPSQPANTIERYLTPNDDLTASLAIPYDKQTTLVAYEGTPEGWEISQELAKIQEDKPSSPVPKSILKARQTSEAQKVFLRSAGKYFLQPSRTVAHQPHQHSPDNSHSRKLSIGSESWESAEDQEVPAEEIVKLPSIDDSPGHHRVDIEQTVDVHRADQVRARNRGVKAVSNRKTERVLKTVAQLRRYDVPIVKYSKYILGLSDKQPTSFLYAGVLLVLCFLCTAVFYCYWVESDFVVALPEVKLDLGILDSLEWVLYACVEYTGSGDIKRAAAGGLMDTALLDKYGDMGGNVIDYLSAVIAVNFEFNQSHIVQYLRAQSDIPDSKFQDFYEQDSSYNDSLTLRSFKSSNRSDYTEKESSRYELYQYLTILTHEYSEGVYDPYKPPSPNELSLRYNSLNSGYASILTGKPRLTQKLMQPWPPSTKSRTT